jgi:dienelactone hydrolase
MTVRTTPVTFYSWGAQCSGVLWRPEGAGDRPGLVLANGFRGVKEWILPEYAELFAEAGFVTLTFDYRGFGASEGIRGNIVPHDQVEDVRSAVTFLAGQDGVDAERIALWGTSFGAANVVVAGAADDRVAAVVCQVGFGDWARALRGSLPSGRFDEIVQRCEKDREQRVRTGRSDTVDPNWVLDNPESAQAMRAVIDRFPNIVREMPLAAIERTLEYRPEAAVAGLSPRPVLFVGTTQDRVVPVEETHLLHAAAAEPKELELLDIDHYQIYQSPYREQAAELAVDFLGRHRCGP